MASYKDFQPEPDDNQAAPPVGAPEGNYKGSVVNNTFRYLMAAVRNLGDAALKRDGSEAPSADTPWGGFKITTLGDGSANQDAATIANVNSAISSQAIKRDGSNSPTATTPWGGFKITGLGTGTGRGDATAVHQLQDGGPHWAGILGGSSNSYTASMAPAYTVAYSNGLKIRGIANFTNTSSTPTLQLDAQSADTIVDQDGNALVPGSIQDGTLYEFTFDGTNWRVEEVRESWGGTTGGTANAQTVTVAGPAPKAAGDWVEFVAGVTNTAADPALAVNGASALTMKNEAGGDLPAGAIISGRKYRAVYDGTNLRVSGCGGTDILANEVLSNAIDFSVVWDNARLYYKIEIIVSGLRPAADSLPIVRTSTDGGSNYANGANAYAWGLNWVRVGQAGSAQSAGDSKINLFDGNVEGDDGNSVSFRIEILDPSNSGSNTAIMFQGRGVGPGGASHHVEGSGERLAEEAVDGFQFLFDDQNIAEGHIKVIGHY